MADVFSLLDEKQKKDEEPQGIPYREDAPKQNPVMKERMRRQQNAKTKQQLQNKRIIEKQGDALELNKINSSLDKFNSLNRDFYQSSAMIYNSAKNDGDKEIVSALFYRLNGIQPGKAKDIIKTGTQMLRTKQYFIKKDLAGLLPTPEDRMKVNQALPEWFVDYDSPIDKMEKAGGILQNELRVGIKVGLDQASKGIQGFAGEAYKGMQGFADSKAGKFMSNFATNVMTNVGRSKVGGDWNPFLGVAAAADAELAAEKLKKDQDDTNYSFQSKNVSGNKKDGYVEDPQGDIEAIYRIDPQTGKQIFSHLKSESDVKKRAEKRKDDQIKDIRSRQRIANNKNTEDRVNATKLAESTQQAQKYTRSLVDDKGNETKVTETFYPESFFKNISDSTSKQVATFAKDIVKEPVFAKKLEAYNAAGDIRAMLDAENPIADNAVRILMPRLLGEVGNLSAVEQKSYGGADAIKYKLQQTMKRWTEGKLSDDNRNFLLEITDILSKSARVNATKYVRGRAKQLQVNIKNKDHIESVNKTADELLRQFGAVADVPSANTPPEKEITDDDLDDIFSGLDDK